jgi:hypothetical protein
MMQLIQYRGAVYRRASAEDVLVAWWRYWLVSTPGGAPEANAEWLLESVQHSPEAAEAQDQVRADRGLDYLIAGPST